MSQATSSDVTGTTPVAPIHKQISSTNGKASVSRHVLKFEEPLARLENQIQELEMLILAIQMEHPARRLLGRRHNNSNPRGLDQNKGRQIHL